MITPADPVAVIIDPSVFTMHWFTAIHCDRPGEYRTIVPLAIQLPPAFAGASVSHGPLAIADGVLRIGVGFAFDGASGIAIDGVYNLLAALIHDCLYTLMEHCRKQCPWSYWTADGVYRDTCIAQGAGRCRAWAHWSGLRAFGWAHRLTHKNDSATTQTGGNDDET